MSFLKNQLLYLCIFFFIQCLVTSSNRNKKGSDNSHRLEIDSWEEVGEKLQGNKGTKISVCVSSSDMRLC